MTIKKGILKEFNSTSYTATVQISGSYKAYLEGLVVSRGIASCQMVPGRKVAVIFFAEHNPAEAVVTAVYT